MKENFLDIINKERPIHIDDGFSRRHPQMCRGDRAKIFAPFAALSGYDSPVSGRKMAVCR